LHPLILHFPIVLTIIALLFEVARYYRFLKVTDSVILIVLFAAALSTLVSVGAGFFLFAPEIIPAIYGETLLGWNTYRVLHFHCYRLFLVYWSTGRFYASTSRLLVISNIVVAYASHLGGSIHTGKITSPNI
jgi:uncharacterized membrane protein